MAALLCVVRVCGPISAARASDLVCAAGEIGQVVKKEAAGQTRVRSHPLASQPRPPPCGLTVAIVARPPARPSFPSGGWAPIPRIALGVRAPRHVRPNGGKGRAPQSTSTRPPTVLVPPPSLSSLCLSTVAWCAVPSFCVCLLSPNAAADWSEATRTKATRTGQTHADTDDTTAAAVSQGGGRHTGIDVRAPSMRWRWLVSVALAQLRSQSAESRAEIITPAAAGHTGPPAHALTSSGGLVRRLDLACPDSYSRASPLFASQLAGFGTGSADCWPHLVSPPPTHAHLSPMSPPPSRCAPLQAVRSHCSAAPIHRFSLSPFSRALCCCRPHRRAAARRSAELAQPNSMPNSDRLQRSTRPNRALVHSLLLCLLGCSASSFCLSLSRCLLE